MRISPTSLPGRLALTAFVLALPAVTGCHESSSEDSSSGSSSSSSGSSSSSSGSTTTFPPSQQLTHVFPMQTVAPGQEILGLCRSWTLNNEEDLWVNTVEFQQDQASHHSNFVYVPDTAYTGPDGIWTATSRNYDFYTAVGMGGVLFAQSTQVLSQVQAFPGPSAIRVPAHSRVISDIHLLNITPDTVTGDAQITLDMLPAADVQTKLSAFHMEYDALNIPAHSSAKFTATCPVAASVAASTGSPFGLQLYYAMPHYHTFATGFLASILGGPKAGLSLIDVGALDGETRGVPYDPPIDMTGADGFTFSCQYTNNGTYDVVWGFGGEEMCELFGFAAATPFFQASVGTGTAEGASGTVQLFGGNCSTTVFAASP